jgi:predicted O-methyltransferase YrrM
MTRTALQNRYWRLSVSYLDRLNALAQQWGSDKGSADRDQRLQALRYMDYYAEYFARHFARPEKVKSVLEIGTNTGASLRIWAEFFPNADVLGVDVTRQYEVAERLDHPRISTHIVEPGRADSSSKAVKWAEHLGHNSFDIIIDDGSHDQYDQQDSLGFLFPYLSRGGLYVIEDIITGEPWWDGNLYNRNKMRPTRDLIRQLEGLDPPSDGPLGLSETQLEYVVKNAEYFNYRETPAIIYERHHPQIAFIGKR